ncbi:MAG: S8 family serine peptidase [bacterium]
MCDTVAGQLIISFASLDEAGHALIDDIKNEAIEHVSFRGSLRERFASLELKMPDDFPFEFHLVEVPAGTEAFKANYLQFFYKQHMLAALSTLPNDVLGRSDMQFSVMPNHVLSLAQVSSGGAKVTAIDFTFDPIHATYRSMVGMSAPSSTGKGVRIAILDSGIAPDHPATVIRRRNFVNPLAKWDVDDDHGHGTVVSLIIHDLVPDAEFVVFKIADDAGRISEWDAVAALAACSDVDVVNLSVAFGLGDRKCKTCGRESHSSRSSVFESTLGHYATSSREPLFVAAAGNASDPALAYPARFGQVLAVGAITSKYSLSSESNFGDLNHVLAAHTNHFVAPGGEPGPAGAESVGTFKSSPGAWHGTSLAAAYATGITACRYATSGTSAHVASAVLPSARASADTSHFGSHDYVKHGHGVLRS